jgi:hypothetical protein
MTIFGLLRRLDKVVDGVTARPNSRWMRRVFIAAVVFTLLTFMLQAGISLIPYRPGARDFYGYAAWISAITAMGYAMWVARMARGLNGGTGLDERALLDFGKPYVDLSPMHQFDVRVRVRREQRRGGPPADERDALMQHEAEQRAYRLLRYALPCLSLGNWLACLIFAHGPMRAGFVISAMVFSIVVAVVLMLPELIRLWTEPDEILEPRTVSKSTAQEA